MCLVSDFNTEPSTSQETLDTEKSSVLQVIPAAEFRDMVNYSSFLNNSNWSRSGLEFVISLGKGYKHL